jgi:SsrA-binding protein
MLHARSASACSSTRWQKDGTLLQMTMRGPYSLYKGAALVTERSYIVATNRQAYHDYFVDETIEAGIVLTGTEVKSIREGKVNLRGAFARIKEGEMWLENVHIAEYEQGTYMNHAPLRDRKLLMHRREIARLTQRIQAKGQTLVPLKLYFKDNHVKVELGLCRGKKLYDKREAIAERESQRELARITKQRLR